MTTTPGSTPLETFVWSDRFLTGEPVVDAEHQSLVRTVNRVGRLHTEPERAGEFMEVLGELVQYAAVHFQHEEELMARTGCDRRHADMHTAIHADFAKQVTAMSAAATTVEETAFLLRFLTNWLTYHILGIDQSMARQVKAIRAGATPEQAFDDDRQTVTDPATSNLLDAMTSLYSLMEVRNQTLARALDGQVHAQHLLTDILEGNPMPTLVINTDHIVTHWNKACEVLTGVPASEMVGTNRAWSPFYPTERPIMADLIVSGDVDRIAALYTDRFTRSTLADGAYESEAFFPQFGADGRWLFFMAAPLHDAGGRIVGAIETVQDQTDLRRALEKLQRHEVALERLVAERTAELATATTQLVQSEKLASIGQLAAGVAHEINNPIGYVHSNIGSLEKYVQDLLRLLSAYESAESAVADAAVRHQLTALRQEVNLEFLREDIPELMRESAEGITRVRKIVQDLRDFSRVDSQQEWQLADLHATIESTLNIIGSELKYTADVVKEYGDLPRVECLSAQLSQVFMNLLVNASHAIGKDRGTITIRTGAGDNLVWLEFSDTGGGIPVEIRQKIFDPFFTTKPVGKGTGLGLSLSYGIIQKHNGTIKVTSDVGRGTTFRITLPVKYVVPVEDSKR